MNSIIQKVLLGQYRVDQHIAATGMSDVFRVWDMKRHVPLAMKVLNTDLAEDPSMLKRFKREAQALRKLNHPHIVPFYGLYQEDDIFFLLELFIDGPNLKDILRKLPDHQMPLDHALIFIKAVCAALGYAHANGVVHCDIKPGNVMVDQGGTIYLTDFGIARHADSSTTTMAGAGTAAYMAPEQIKGEPVNPATDVYALGVMLFEMLTGRRPFRGDDNLLESTGTNTAERLRYAHLNLPPPDPRDYCPGISQTFADVILKALNKLPEERFASANDFFSAVCKAVNISPNEIPDRYDLSSFRLSTDQLPVIQQTNLEVSSKPGKRPLPFWIFAGSGVLAIFVLVLLFATNKIDLNLIRGNKNNSNIGSTAIPLIEISPTFTGGFVQTKITTPTVTASPKPTQPNITAKDGQSLIYIPDGEFKMGLTWEQIDAICQIDSGCDRDMLSFSTPVHTVNLSEYYIYQTEVTNAQYAMCVRENACSQPRKFSSHIYDDYYSNPRFQNYPVVYVNWYQAAEYCEWAGGRLPTEAEWEKAARGTQGYLWPWGNAAPATHLANLLSTNSGGDNTEVGSFPSGASPYGLMDMTGNVYEWVADWYSPTFYRESPAVSTNPTGPEKLGNIQYKVVRGGSSAFETWVSSAGVHDWDDPNNSGYALGFRCVQDVISRGGSIVSETPTNVQHHKPSWSEYQSIKSLWNLAHFQDLFVPGEQQYQIHIQHNDSWKWDFTWCANSKDRLYQILEPLSVLFLIDGNSISSDTIYQYEGESRSEPGQQCHYWSVILSEWQPGRTVNLQLTYSLSQDIFDGSQHYQAGDYSQIFQVTVD